MADRLRKSLKFAKKKLNEPDFKHLSVLQYLMYNIVAVAVVDHMKLLYRLKVLFKTDEKKFGYVYVLFINIKSFADRYVSGREYSTQLDKLYYFHMNPSNSKSFIKTSCVL